MINFVVALPAEARPLIKAFGLRHSASHRLFRVYSGKNVNLVVTGVGKMLSGAACAWLYSSLNEPQHAAWMNVGVAGHAEANLGEGFIVNKITDAASNNNWYPSRIGVENTPGAELITVDHVQAGYPDTAMCDMEASGFYAITSRFATCELIQCYKIISDNTAHSSQGVSAKRVEQQITQRVDTIKHITAALDTISHHLETVHAEPTGFADFLDAWHFSVTQQHQLKRLLKQWRLRSGQGMVDVSRVSHLKSSRQVLLYLQQGIAEFPVRLSSAENSADKEFT